MTDALKPPETPLARALRRIAKGRRLSSLDVPVLNDAADEIDALTATLQTVKSKETRRHFDDY